MIDDRQVEELRVHLIDLAQRLAELDVSIEDGIEDDHSDARRSLTEAFSAFNRLANIIDPELVVPQDD